MKHRPSFRRLVLAALIPCLGLVAAPPPADASGPQPRLRVSTEPADLLFPEPVSAIETYRSWGRAFDVEVLFDPKVRDREIVIELRDKAPVEMLRILHLLSGYFHVVVADRTILVIEDTPQNRRFYEPQVLQTFVLENLDIKDAMTLVRSLLGLKNVAAHQEQNAFVLRDSAARIQLAEAILNRIDKPRAEVLIDLEVLYLPEARRAEALAGLGDEPPREDHRHRRLPRRLSEDQLEALRAASRVLADPGLNLLSGEEGRWRLEDATVLPGGEGQTSWEVGLELEVEARLRAASGEVEIEARLVARDARLSADAPVVRSSREARWSARIAADESFLISGFLRTGEDVPAEPGSQLVSLLHPAARDGGEILIALTPHVVRTPGYTENDLAALCVGTEYHLELCEWP